jgi:hypothetical protein
LKIITKDHQIFRNNKGNPAINREKWKRDSKEDVKENFRIRHHCLMIVQKYVSVLLKKGKNFLTFRGWQVYIVDMGWQNVKRTLVNGVSNYLVDDKRLISYGTKYYLWELAARKEVSPGSKPAANPCSAAEARGKTFVRKMAIVYTCNPMNIDVLEGFLVLEQRYFYENMPGEPDKSGVWVLPTIGLIPASEQALEKEMAKKIVDQFDIQAP